MNNTIITILCGLVAAFAAAGAFPFVLRYAIKHDIVDNPNARKLQRVPVPVLGGTVVYIGILVGTAVMSLFMDSDFLLWGFIGMTIMAIIGTWDDIKDLPAVFRFVVEIFIIGAFIAIKAPIMNISTTKRKTAGKSLISSHVPIMAIIVIPIKPHNRKSLSMNTDITAVPTRIPIYTTVPPSTGTGTRCSFLALGLSTMSCLMA